jgi:DNA polymerase II small subunit
MNEELNKKRDAVRKLLEQGLLVSPDFLQTLQDDEVESLQDDQDVLVMNNDVNKLLIRKEKNINWQELEKLKVLSEKGQKPGAYSSFLDALTDQSVSIQELENKTQKKLDASPVKIVSSYTTMPTKRTVQDFVDYYNARYKSIQNILMKRAELSNLIQISRLKTGEVSESVSVIGMVQDTHPTKFGHVVLNIEDPTGIMTVVINKTKRELHDIASNTVFDEVIAVTGRVRNGTLFATNITLPDVPIREPKNSPNEGYAVCMSDLHFGSAQFLEEDFLKFIKWINGDLGNEKQKKIASKVKYVLVAGDIVDGIGIYQDQYDELTIKDAEGQYTKCAEFLAKIPTHIKIVISPGNHDTVRAAEPQTSLTEDFASALIKLPNVTLVSNPATVNIDSSEGFSGFDVLLYHGYSFDYYVANVDSIRKNGGYERGDLIMKFLLQRRHLAPAHTSTLILPDKKQDPLFIDPVPDIFVTGHIHRTSVSEYRGIPLINSSCWQGMTKFQERMGHTPQPSRIPIFNLKTREISIINFGS